MKHANSHDSLSSHPEEEDYSNLPFLCRVRSEELPLAISFLTNQDLTIEARAEYLEEHLTISDLKLAKEWMKEQLSNFIKYLPKQSHPIVERLINNKDYVNLKATVYGAAKRNQSEGEQIKRAFDYWLAFHDLNDDKEEMETNKSPENPTPVEKPQKETTSTRLQNKILPENSLRRSESDVIVNEVSNEDLHEKLEHQEDTLLKPILENIKEVKRSIIKTQNETIAKYEKRIADLEKREEQLRDQLRNFEVQERRHVENQREWEKQRTAEIRGRLEEEAANRQFAAINKQS